MAPGKSRRTQSAPTLARQQASGQSSVNHYFGKYRGHVLNDLDPECLGRIMVSVPAISGMLTNWAMPCVPYAGLQVGFYFIPPIGANVWVEFEAGDPTYPIWSGCFWAEGEVPMVEGPPNPLVKILRTEFITLVMSDLPEAGGLLLNVMPPATATPLSMTFTSEGININAAPAIITMIPEEGITLTYPPAVITMTEAESSSVIGDTALVMTPAATELNSPVISLTAEGDLTGSAGGALNLTSGADLSVASGAALEISAGVGVMVSAAAAIEMQAAAEIGIKAVGDVNVEAVGALLLSAAGDASLTAVGNATVSAVAVELVGVVTADGVPVPLPLPI